MALEAFLQGAPSADGIGGAAMDLWAYTNGVVLDSSRCGKLTDNAAIESFNGRFREECLNVHWFASLADAQQKIDAFRWDYMSIVLTVLSACCSLSSPRWNIEAIK